jgi:serine/threonine protein kinase
MLRGKIDSGGSLMNSERPHMSVVDKHCASLKRQPTIMDDSLRHSTKSSPQLNQEDQSEHAVLRSKPIPNDFASFIMFMSSMFSESNHAVHYHSPSTVLLSPPLDSGLSFEVSRFRIPRDRDRIRINKDTVLRKGDDIIYKRPLIKLANTGRILEENILKAVILEVRILSHEPIRKHPHIVRLLGIAWDRDRHSSLMMPTLVVEYGNQGTLSEYMINAGPLSLRCRLQLALEIAEGILALHRAGVIHADIKASNVLVFGSGEAVTAKISDFGSAILVDEIPDGESVDISVYSQLWNAPEYRERLLKVALPAVDAYSFGPRGVQAENSVPEVGFRGEGLGTPPPLPHLPYLGIPRIHVNVRVTTDIYVRVF